MLKITLEKVNDKKYNLKSENEVALKLELKPVDIEIYKDMDDYFFIKLKKTVFNLKLNKLIGMLQNEIIRAIELNSYYFNSVINVEKYFIVSSSKFSDDLLLNNYSTNSFPILLFNTL
jgi:hypothetical protein